MMSPKHASSFKRRIVKNLSRMWLGLYRFSTYMTLQFYQRLWVTAKSKMFRQCKIELCHGDNPKFKTDKQHLLKIDFPGPFLKLEKFTERRFDE